MTDAGSQSTAPHLRDAQSSPPPGLGERTRSEARAAAESVQDTARDAGERARQAATDAGRRLRERGTSLAAEQKDRLAEEFTHFSTAMRHAAETLHDEGDDTIADYADVAAERIEGMSGYLRESDLGRLVHDAEQATRRRPELVYGGLFVAGLALSRFLKASARNRQRSHAAGETQFPQAAY